MIITNCPRCGAMNVTTTCNKCGWSQFTKSTVSTGARAVEWGEEMSEMKLCPFCGWEFAEHAWNEFGEEYRVCDQCGASSGTVDSKWDWQSRPIEDELRKRIAVLEAERRWVPVSEGTKGLEILEDYLTTDESGEIYKMKYCGVLRGVQKWLRSDNAFYHPTHWMPLPELPEVK